MRRFLLGLVLLAFLFGSPYAAVVLNRATGPWSATAIEQDGTTTSMQFNPDMPAADFVPIYPGASVVQSSRVVSATAPSGVGFIDLAVHASAAEVRDFYRSQWEAAGFTVDDLGTMGLNPAAAAYLGVDGALVAKRPATRRCRRDPDPRRRRRAAPLAGVAAAMAQIVGVAGGPAEAVTRQLPGAGTKTSRNTASSLTPARAAKGC